MMIPALAGCNAMEGTLLGGGLGAGTGALVGSMSGNAGAGTAIGAGAGALTGLIVGAALEQQQKRSQAMAANQGMQPTGVVKALSAQPVGQVIVACPHCGQHIDVSGFKPGSRVKCPVCGTVFTFD